MTSDSNPFKAQPDWEHNACVNNFMQFSELGSAYARSGDDLVETMLHDCSKLEVHVYSACFLYRHALELCLKDLVWKSHYALTGEKRYAERDLKELGLHELTRLWTPAVRNAEKLLGDDFPLDTGQREAVRTLLDQFEQHDPGSYSFRYPILKEKQKGKDRRTHPELKHVNVSALREKVRQVLSWLAEISEGLNYHVEQRSKCDT
jgi:hypothetical protein